MTTAKHFFLVLFSLLTYSKCFAATAFSPATAATIALPDNCYTQGMSYHESHLWLSCGLYGQSKIYILSSQTGEIIKQQSFPRYWFAEGNTLIDKKIIQLTWKNGIIAELDKHQLSFGKRHTVKGEAWGISYHRTHGLVMSDGTAALTWLDPLTFSKTKTLLVHDGDQTIANLNELEWVDNTLWANIWQQSKIAIIDPDNGQVLQWLDLEKITAEQQNQDGEVLNGIAYLPEQKQVWITGKNWQTIYSIDIDQLHPNISE